MEMQLHAFITAALDTRLRRDFHSADAFPTVRARITKIPGSTVSCRTAWAV